ncbi:MAG: Polysaccharide biosynthesis protein [Myxococcales bacterium]|nr:Polysaccharide biosynthesis protein [Myxococcales bacterium]
MSTRRGDNGGSGGGRRGGGDVDRPDVRDRNDVDETRVDSALPPSRALAVRRHGQLLVPQSGLPQVAARLPVGMATMEQVDGFRELRTRLLAMATALDLQYFTTLVVPMTAGSGASFVARNLAAAFTLQDNQMAMLVDCNLRHPTQHQALGARTDDGGLFDFLEQPHAAIDQLVRPTAIPGLHLIPAGHPPSRPREYFSSPAMRMLMSALRQESCYVFLDGPPTKGSPDARILADLADFVILVLGYGCATTDTIVQTAAMFDPAKFAGVVFNERS